MRRREFLAASATAQAPEEAIGIIGGMGFDAIRRNLERRKFRVSQFILSQSAVEGLTSLDAAGGSRSLDFFEKGCRLARSLNAPILNIVAPWPRELKGPVDYLPRYYDIEKPEAGEKFHLGIAPGFDWDRVWTAYIDTTKARLHRVKAHGIKLSLEQDKHPGDMKQTAQRFLKMMKEYLA